MGFFIVEFAGLRGCAGPRENAKGRKLTRMKKIKRISFLEFVWLPGFAGVHLTLSTY